MCGSGRPRGGGSDIKTIVRQTLIGLTAALAALSSVPAAAQTGEVLQAPASGETRQLLSRAESLLSTRDAVRAYELLRPREPSLAGNPYFDYLFGIAALDTGRHGEAIFALRRALSVEPAFSGAKMELARAYYESGARDQARRLFASLLDENPPRGVREVLTRYIAVIDRQPPPASPSFLPYAELTAGYDTNANGSTDDNQFLGFMLSGENVETDSPFAEAAGGFTATLPRSRNFAWYAGARASYRDNADAPFVDAGVISALGGFSWQRGAVFGRLGIDGYATRRDGESNEAYRGVDARIGRRFGPGWDFSIGVRGGVLTHDSSIEILDVDRLLYTAGLGYRYAPTTEFRLEVLGGEDDERNPGSPYGNSKLGARLGFQTSAAAYAVSASVGSLTSEYDGLFFGSEREDTQLTASLEFEFRDVFADGLALVPSLRFIDNDSDIDLYDYDRTVIGLMLRWMPQ